MTELFPGLCRQEDSKNGPAVKQLKQKLALNSTPYMAQLQSHPIATTPPASPQTCRVHVRKAGFSHGGIPPNALMGPQVRQIRTLGSAHSLRNKRRSSCCECASLRLAEAT